VRGECVGESAGLRGERGARGGRRGGRGPVPPPTPLPPPTCDFLTTFLLASTRSAPREARAAWEERRGGGGRVGVGGRGRGGCRWGERPRWDVPAPKCATNRGRVGRGRAVNPANHRRRRPPAPGARRAPIQPPCRTVGAGANVAWCMLGAAGVEARPEEWGGPRGPPIPHTTDSVPSQCHPGAVRRPPPPPLPPSPGTWRAASRPRPRGAGRNSCLLSCTRRGGTKRRAPR